MPSLPAIACTLLLVCALPVAADPPKVLPLDAMGTDAITQRYALLDEPTSRGSVFSTQITPPGCHGGTSVGYPAPAGWRGAPNTMPPAVAGPVVTLVGPTGSRVVRSTRHVSISGPLGSQLRDTPALAVPVDRQADYRVALVGELAGVQWRQTSAPKHTPALQRANRAWLAAHGVANPRAIYPVRLDGTELDVLFVYPAADTAAISIVRRGGKLVAREVGDPMGVIELRGAAVPARYLLLRAGNRVRTIAIESR